MKNILVVALAVLSFSEISLAQSNMIFPGETKSFRTHGARRLTVTCSDNMSSGAVSVGFFWDQNCTGKIVAAFELTGDVIEDRYICDRNSEDVYRHGKREDRPLHSRFESVSLNGVCKNFGIGAPDASDRSDWHGTAACGQASKFIREQVR